MVSGLVGQAAHATTLAEERERFDLVAVVDPSVSLRSAVAQRFQVPYSTETLADAIVLGLDAVVVAVPDPAHVSVCLEALGAGLHVFAKSRS